MSKIAVHTTLTIALSGLLATPAYAATLDINVEIPKLNVAEYHRPYVAVWYQNEDTKEGHGTKWLPDLRQWWRKSGRSLKVPVDGVTGPTKPVGKHALSFSDKQHLAKLAPGQYTLVVEAAREVGGRELLKIPFTWPAKGAPQSGKAQGATELGSVTLTVKP